MDTMKKLTAYKPGEKDILSDKKHNQQVEYQGKNYHLVEPLLPEYRHLVMKLQELSYVI